MRPGRGTKEGWCGPSGELSVPRGARSVRVRSGDLALSQIQALAHRDGVRLVVLESGRLKLVPGLLDWTAAAYPVREQAGDAVLLEAP